ncbi:MAG: hypothetical protein ABEJ92_02470 [Halobacteriales archaeon]
MPPTPDELAGTVDGFGGLTREELVGALSDLAARTGEDLDPDAVERAIDDAVARYYLLEVGSDAVGGGPDEPLLVAGPAALPTLPAGGGDLPHLLDVEPRTVDRRAAARQVEERLRGDAAAAVDDGDDDRAERLLDACYAVEAWGPVDLGDAKEQLADLLD